MYRPLPLGVSLIVLLAGCAYKEPAVKLPEPAPASAQASVREGSSTFTVEGVGPYLLGADFIQLQAQGRLEPGDPYCAHGVAPYQDISALARPGGTVYLVVNRSATLATPSGARVGWTLNQLKVTYGAAGEELNKSGYLVKSPSGNGLRFDFDVNSKKVTAVVAGNAADLRESFTNGADYC